LAKIDEHTGEPVRDPDTGLVIRCDPGEPGELVGKIIKFHCIRDFQGYTDESATDKKILRSVFQTDDYAFRTGDILVMDEFGYFYFKGIVLI
jgi:solute carrier family 27 fatty acid transporter 1/4